MIFRIATIEPCSYPTCSWFARLKATMPLPSISYTHQVLHLHQSKLIPDLHPKNILIHFIEYFLDSLLLLPHTSKPFHPRDRMLKVKLMHHCTPVPRNNARHQTTPVLNPGLESSHLTTRMSFASYHESSRRRPRLLRSQEQSMINLQTPLMSISGIWRLVAC